MYWSKHLLITFMFTKKVNLNENNSQIANSK